MWSLFFDSYKLYARNSAPKSADWIDLVWRVHLEPFFGGFFASRIGTDKLQEYIAERQEAGAKNSTINRELAILKAVFNNGSNCDPPKILRIPRFPSKLDEPNPRSGFLTDEQYGKASESLQAPMATSHDVPRIHIRVP